MTDSKAYTALTYLTAYELNSFRKFLESPYFNSNRDCLTLFEIFNSALKSQTPQEDLEKEIVWSTIYPDDDFDYNKLRKLVSELLKLLEDFLAQKCFDNNKFLKSNLRLKAISEKRIEKLFKSSVSSSIRNIEQTYNRSSEYLYARYANEREKLNLYSESEILRKRSKNIESEVNISEISKYLDQFYLAEKLKYYVKLLGWKKMISLEQEMDHIQEMNQMIASGKFDNIAPVVIYNTISKTQLEPDNVDHYFQLRQQVNDFIDFFPDAEIRNIYDALLSFCVRRVNKGDLSFQEETLSIYKEALAKEVLLQDGQITATTYNNVVFFALRTGQYDWAEGFIEKYRPLLNERDRESAVAFSKARLEFYRKNYGEVISLLQQVQMSSVVFNLSAKTILLLSYYELDEFDALDSFMNSFRVYLNREKSISTRKKGHYKNLLKYLNKTIKLSSSDKEGLIKLKETVQNTPGVVTKPWLLQKIDEKGGFN